MVAQANGRPVIGSQPRYAVQNIPAPNASPGFANMQVPGGAQTFVIGGLTKLEHAAIEIAARNPNIHPQQAVQVASDVLNTCLDYDQARQEATDEEDEETPPQETEAPPSPIVLP